MVNRSNTVRPHQSPDRVYCAGPLFNAAERGEMERIAEVLKASGFDTFVPHADGMEFAQVFPYLVDQGHCPEEVGELLHEAVFSLDTYQVVEGCGTLVFNMNGRVPDEGGVAELTMAWALGKPVVIYKEDARSAISGRDNPLIVGQTGFQVHNNLEDVVSDLRQQIVEHSLPVHTRISSPPGMQSAVTAGRQLWQELKTLGSERPSEHVARIILGLFARKGISAK